MALEGTTARPLGWRALAPGSIGAPWGRAGIWGGSPRPSLRTPDGRATVRPVLAAKRQAVRGPRPPHDKPLAEAPRAGSRTCSGAGGGHPDPLAGPRSPRPRGAGAAGRARGKLSGRRPGAGMGPRAPDLREPRGASRALPLPGLQASAGLGPCPSATTPDSGFSPVPDGRPPETDGAARQWQGAKRQLCVRPPLSASARAGLPSPAFRVGRPLLAARG